MTTTALDLERDAIEAHVLRVTAEERRTFLARAIVVYEARGWDDLAAEYKVRLDEIERLFLEVNVASMQGAE